MAELVQDGKDHTDLFPALSGPNFAIQTAKMDRYEVISLIYVLEKIFKRKHFGVK